MQFPYILVWKLHTEACEIVAGTKRKPCKKFHVDICKTKKDRSAHAQLCQAKIYNAARVRRLSTKLQVDSDTCKTKKRYICACAVVHLVVEIKAMIYNAARVRRLSTKFQVDTYKTKRDRSAHAQLLTL